MREQPWSQESVTRGAAAALLAAAMLVPTAGGAHPMGDHPAPSVAHQIVTFGYPNEGPKVDELDPTDDGYIIIECVGFAGPAAVGTNGPPLGMWTHSVAVPQFPLGPSHCSPKEHGPA